MDEVKEKRTEIYLIRHGKTRENEEHRYCGGGTDSELSPEGMRKLRQNVRKGVYDSLLKTILSDENAEKTVIVTAGMRRTEQTLECILGSGIPHRICPELREIDFGEFEGKTYDTLKDLPSYQRWIEGDNELNRCPGGESGAEMTERVLSAYGSIVADAGPGGKILIITHGGPIAAIMKACFPEEGRNRYEWQPPCGGGYRIFCEEEIRSNYLHI